MWLVKRATDATGSDRIQLPAIVRAALVRWYSGEGSPDDEDVGITLVQQARIGARWLACDCLPACDAPPILTPAYLSEAETYYLRRLTSAKRPEHHPHCPFFRDQVTNRLTAVRHAQTPVEPPPGFFEVLKPAPEQLAQRPDEDESDDRTRQASVPRLAKLLWRLLEIAGLGQIEPASLDASIPSIAGQFRRLCSVATRVEVAPGIELARVLWTHGAALRSGRIYTALRALEPKWPLGHAAQGYLITFANKIHGQWIELAGSEPVHVANRVQSPSSRSNPIGGPYLVIVVIGRYPEADRYQALRAYAQPIYSGHFFVPMETAFDREVLRALLGIRRWMDGIGVDLAISRPIFDRQTVVGALRPDFVLEARSRLTGEVRELAIEGVVPGSPDYRAAKEASVARTRLLLPTLEVRPADVKRGDLASVIERVLSL